MSDPNALAPVDSTAEPVRARISLPHVGALDGLRGAAVAGVLLYHGGHLKGGYLGVDLFFVLSGYLITSLLLAEWRATDRVSLGNFWARRARRLLPALVLVLLGIAIYCVAFADPAELARIRGDALATIAYVANWRAIFAHQSYFDLFLTPSPLQHTWSLAIEEQFYVLWPLIFVGLVAWWKRRTPQAVFVTALLCGTTSTLLMAGLYSKADTNRAYYGTDTRSFALFAGITIAAAVAIWGFPKDRLVRFMIEAAAIVSLVVLVVMWTTLDGQAPRLYQGGFAVAGIAAALLIAAAAHPTRGPLNRMLSLAPLRWLGLISYGLYLWHWPVDIVVTGDRLDLSGWPLFALRTAIALGIAIASYFLIEMPIRRGGFSARQWRVAIPAIAAALVAILVLTTASSPAPTAIAATGSDGAQAVGTGPGRRVLLFGDSVANSLRPGLDRAGLQAGVWWRAGCRLIHGTLKFHNQFTGDCRWESALKKVTEASPPEELLVLIGAWDLFDVQPAGSRRFVTPGSPDWDQAFRDQLEHVISMAEQRNIHITLLTVPCASRGSSAATNYEPGAAAIGRVRAANRVIKDTAAHHSKTVSVADLFGFLCPGNKYQTRVKGVVTRSDGVHLSDGGADLVAHWLLPQLHLDTATPASTPTPPSLTDLNPNVATAAMSRQALGLQQMRLDEVVSRSAPRVLLTGDSMAFSLGAGANQRADAPLGVLAAAMIGCGIEKGVPVGPRFLSPAKICRQWPKLWRRAIDVMHPKALILLNGVWDMWDRDLDGHRIPMYSTALRRNLLGELERARKIAADAHIPFVLLTAPCLAPTSLEAERVGPGLGDPRRVKWLNATYAEFAGQHSDVSLIPFGEHICSSRPSPLTDGVHLSVPGAIAAWTWLTPQIQSRLDAAAAPPGNG